MLCFEVSGGIDSDNGVHVISILSAEAVQEINSLALSGVCMGKEQEGRKSSNSQGHCGPV